MTNHANNNEILQGTLRDNLSEEHNLLTAERSTANSDDMLETIITHEASLALRQVSKAKGTNLEDCANS